ncbi:MAG: FkbM family methyltransferase [Deltaproteobacteria bacterium]|nr:FkbM family methyltransferase [Myxococcales bacterium]MDP3217653.1 FkbM family methyltransferase [Deltaproteobacteria bacterium]
MTTGATPSTNDATAPIAPSPSPAEELDRLLAETVPDARARESSRFGDIADDPSRPVVLLGSGGLGRRTLAGLRAIGREVVAFTDNSSSRWGSEVDGVPVLSPDEAARRYGESAVFIVSIWRAEGGFRTSALVDELRARGCRRVARIGELYWAHPAQFLPYFGIDLPSRALASADAIREALSLFDDPASRAEYVEQVRWRLHLDADGLAAKASEPIYFTPEIVRFRDDEVLVDAGAFDGDTLGAFVSATGGRFARAVALEPDPKNLDRLHARVAAFDPETRARIELVPVALGREDGEARFVADGTGAARLSRSAETVVPLRRLASIPGGADVTFFKLDIEGAEPAALEGAREIIERNRPLLTVSVYHEQDHLWRIPLLLREMLPSGYRWFLRAYSREGFDLVLYAIPHERLVGPG